MASLADLSNLLTSVGAPTSVVAALTAIPTAEDASGSTAANPDSNGTTSVGWWQINSANFAWLTQVLGTPVNAQTLTDPTLNAKAAVALATQTPAGLNNWTTWTAYQDAAAGATNLTAAQKQAATSVSAALGAIGAGNAAATPYGTASTTVPSTFGNLGSIAGIVQSGGLAGFIAGLGALLQGQGWAAANQSAANSTATAKAQMQAAANGAFTSPGAIALIAIAVGVLIVAWLLAQTHDDSTNVTIAAPAAGAAAA